MKIKLLLIILFYAINSFSEISIHYLYSDILLSTNIFKVTAIYSDKDSVTFKIDSILLGKNPNIDFTLAQREIKYLLYGCVDAMAIKTGEKRIIFLNYSLSDTLHKYRLRLDLKLVDDKVLLPYPVDLGIKNENIILQKSNDLFFDRILDLTQLYEGIRILNLCNNIDQKQTIGKNIRCDNNKLDEISKTNFVIRGWRLSQMTEYERMNKKY